MEKKAQWSILNLQEYLLHFTGYTALVFILFLFSKPFQFNSFHLFSEMTSSFIELYVFFMFVVTPIWKKTIGVAIIGITFFLSAIFDIMHAIYFPGNVFSNVSASISYWMFARGLQSVGLLIGSLLINKREKENTLYFLFPFGILIFVLLALLPNLLVTSIFYSTAGTTLLKTILEFIYAILFFIFAIIMRKDKDTFFSGLFLAASEICLAKYSSVTPSSMLLGHCLKIAGLSAFAKYVYIHYIYAPFKELRETQETFKEENKTSKEIISELMRRWNDVALFRNEILKCKSVDEVFKLEEEFFKDKDKTIPLAKFKEDKLLFKNDDSLPLNRDLYNESEFDKCDLDSGITVFLKKSASTYASIYKQLYLFINLAIKNLNSLEQLKKLNQDLEKAENYRINFIKSFSHKLKTPLNVAYGYLQLLESGAFGELSNEAKEALKDAIESLRKAWLLANNILELAKAESGSLSIKPTRINVREFLDVALAEVKKLAKQKGLNFIIEAVGDPEISIDPTLFSLILTNLSSNAVKYTDTGFVKVSLSCKENESVTLSVEDSGKGIGEDEIDKIFLPFYKGSEDKESHGLGLSIVRAYVALMGGTIKVESSIGKGSKFVVFLPASSQKIDK